MQRKNPIKRFLCIAAARLLLFAPAACKSNPPSQNTQSGTSHCPQRLDIPALLALYNEHCFTEGGFIAPMALMAAPKEQWPSACIGCRICETVCPQQIKISQAMSDFTKRLEA